MQILNDLRRAGSIAEPPRQGRWLFARPDGNPNHPAADVEGRIPHSCKCSVTRDGDSGQAARRAWNRFHPRSRESLDRITLESLASN